MNNTDQNYTDNFFKQGLSSPPEVSPTDKNWDEMERLLASKAKGHSMAWIYAVSGLAAAILIFLSLWITPEKTDTTSQQAQKIKSTKTDPEAVKSINPIRDITSPGDNRRPPGISLPEDDVKLPSAAFKGAVIRGNNADQNNLRDALKTAGELQFAGDRTGVGSINSARYSNIQSSNTGKFSSQRDIDLAYPTAVVAKAVVAEKKDPDARIPAPSGRWGVSLAFSPDVNSVKNMHNGNLGTSMGMGVSYRLGKSLSVGTGVYYSQKLYTADKTSYKVTEKPFATWTSYSKKIDADCRVIDVPVNLSLRISNKTSNKLYASAGMSSYFMLSEKYEFVYTVSPAYPTGRREYTVRNENKHILNIVNLSIALEKPLSSQVGLIIQPYAKLPLTGIGKGQTDLKSVGIGIGLNYSVKKKL